MNLREWRAHGRRLPLRISSVVAAALVAALCGPSASRADVPAVVPTDAPAVVPASPPSAAPAPVAVSAAAPATAPATASCRAKVLAIQPAKFHEQPIQLTGVPPIPGMLFAGDFYGNGSQEILDVLLTRQQVQLTVYHREAKVLELEAPQPLPPECHVESVTVADIDGKGRDVLVGVRQKELVRITIGSGGTTSCATWRPVPNGRSVVQLVTANRGHRMPDAVVGIDNSQRRIVWDRGQQSQEFACPLFMPWDQRVVNGALSLGAEEIVNVIACRRTNGNCSVQSPGKILALTNWLALPESNLTYDPPLFGDIDGDGREDLLMREKELGGWSVAFGQDTFGFEQVVHGLPPRVATGTRFVLFDADGDGTSDMLMFPAGNGPAKLFLSETAHPLANVQLREALTDHPVTASDAAGVYTLSAGVTQELHPFLPGYEFTPSAIATGARCPVILAEPAADPGATPGRAFRRAGEDPGPYVCTGYNPGSVGKWGEPQDGCPKGYAAVATDDVAGVWPSVAATPVSSVCCRLPKSDILTGQEVLSAEECPQGAISVGADQNVYCSECPKLLRCAQVNIDRYMLGPPENGRYWGIGRNMRWMGRHTDKRDVPVALREALGRLTSRSWDVDGCIGQHFGSVLTKKSQTCDQERYQQLLYKGLPGDPPAGTPVAYFPDCDELSDDLGSVAACVRRGASEKPNVEP